jgi:hypothetical protein
LPELLPLFIVESGHRNVWLDGNNCMVPFPAPSCS